MAKINLSNTQFLIVALIILVLLFIFGKCHLRCEGIRRQPKRGMQNNSSEEVQTDVWYCLQTSGGTKNVIEGSNTVCTLGGGNCAYPFQFASSNNCVSPNLQIKIHGNNKNITPSGSYAITDNANNSWSALVGYPVTSLVAAEITTPYQANMIFQFDGSNTLYTNQPFKIYYDDGWGTEGTVSKEFDHETLVVGGLINTDVEWILVPMDN